MYQYHQDIVNDFYLYHALQKILFIGAIPEILIDFYELVLRIVPMLTDQGYKRKL